MRGAEGQSLPRPFQPGASRYGAQPLSHHSFGAGHSTLQGAPLTSAVSGLTRSAPASDNARSVSIGRSGLRHIIILAMFAVVATSAFTTVLINGAIFGADTVSSASEDTATEAMHPSTAVDDQIQGDVDCDGDVDVLDALKELQYIAGLAVVQSEPCPDVGTAIPAGEGVPGPQGPQGIPGPEGPTGLSDIELVVDDGPSDSADTKFLDVNCPPGKTAISGGGVVLSNGANPANIALTGTLSHLDAEGWEVFAREINPTGANWFLRARVLCATVAE